MTADIGYLQTKIRELNEELEKTKTEHEKIIQEIKTIKQYIDKTLPRAEKANEERKEINREVEVHVSEAKKSFDADVTRLLQIQLRPLFEEIRHQAVDNNLQTSLVTTFLTKTGIMDPLEFVEFVDKEWDFHLETVKNGLKLKKIFDVRKIVCMEGEK